MATSGSYTYGDIAGMWKIEYTSSGVLYKTYIDLSLTSGGAVDTAKSKVLLTTVNDGATSTEKLTLNSALTLTAGEVRSLTFTINVDEVWTLTEEDGDYKVTSKDGGNPAVTIYPNSADDTASVTYTLNHNHLYDTTSAMAADTSIYKDTNFKVMKHNGYPMIADGTEERVAATSGYDYDGTTGLTTAIVYKKHYLECTVCGLDYLEVEHTDKQEQTNSSASAVKIAATCPVCGYTVSKKAADGVVFHLVSVNTSVGV